MDSLSQIVLGAAVGEIMYSKKIGWRAALWGAALGTIPDLDILFKGFYDHIHGTAMHRGFSHSIIFCLLLSPIVAWLGVKWHGHRTGVSFRSFAFMAFMCLFTHPILDCFTTWGTQLFWPLPERVSFQSVFVIDPLYTLPFLGFLIAALRAKRTSQKRTQLMTIGIVLSTGYLMLSLVLKNVANQKFEAAMAQQNIAYKRYATRPAPLSTMLWIVNAETEEGYYVAYYSIFDKTIPKEFQFYPKNDHLLSKYAADEQVQLLKFISKGYYTVEKNGAGLIVNDLRFGDINALTGRPQRFVFRYILEPQSDGSINILEPEDGNRPKDMDMGQLMGEIWTRIKGI